MLFRFLLSLANLCPASTLAEQALGLCSEPSVGPIAQHLSCSKKIPDKSTEKIKIFVFAKFFKLFQILREVKKSNRESTLEKGGTNVLKINVLFNLIVVMIS